MCNENPTFDDIKKYRRTIMEEEIRASQIPVTMEDLEKRVQAMNIRTCENILGIPHFKT